MAPQESLPMKGVMLAERPAWALPGPPPFVPACSIAEPWGLNPPAKQSVSSSHTSITMPATTVHKRWIRALNEAYRLQRSQEQEQSLELSRQKQAVAAFSCKLRKAVLQGGDISFWKPVKTESTCRASAGGDQSPLQSGAPGSAVLVQPFVPGNQEDSTCEQAVHEPLQIQEPSATSDTAPGAKSTVPKTTPNEECDCRAAISEPAVVSQSSAGKRPHTSRPAWSLTKEAVESAAAADEAQLITFADTLDYNSFLASLEDMPMRTSLQDLDRQEQAAPCAGSTRDGEDSWRSDFIQALNGVTRRLPKRTVQPKQEVAEELHNDATSMISRSTRSTCQHCPERAAQGTETSKDWDASSTLSRNASVAAMQQSSMAEAQECLREYPDLKHLHSAASIRAQLARDWEDVAVEAGRVARCDLPTVAALAALA